jgi:hypothetical protein
MDKTRFEADGPQQIWEIIRQKSAEFWNIISSIDSGIFCSERDFDLKVLAPSLQKVIKAYDIKYDPESPIPSDNGLADDVYEAAFDLYLEVGTYVSDARRRIKFDEEYGKKF